MPVGTTFFDDDNLDTNVTYITGAPIPTGAVPLIPVGTVLDVSGFQWFRFLVAGHAVKEIEALFQGGIQLDAGMFGGIIETTEGLQYDVVTECTGRLIPWTVAGPTCDSVDVVMRDQLLPENLDADDFVYLPNAAAYTTAYASNFNGFPLPEVRILGA